MTLTDTAICNLERIDCLERIEFLQEIQKRNPPNSEAWHAASEQLAPLFERMSN